MAHYNRYKDLTSKTKILSEISQNTQESVAQSYQKVVVEIRDTSFSSVRYVKSTLYLQPKRLEISNCEELDLYGQKHRTEYFLCEKRQSGMWSIVLKCGN